MPNATGVSLVQSNTNKFPNVVENHTYMDTTVSNDRELKTQLMNACFNEIAGVQNITYAATITPDASQGSVLLIGALTGNITVNLPINPTLGQGLMFFFVQDATGGRTITLNAAFKANWTPSTVASKRNNIQFIYDGTNWHQVGSAVGI